MNVIQIACETKDTLDWRVIKPLQGGLKKRTPEHIEKLCSLIIKRGIRFPSFVAKIGDDIWAIDTHGRLLAYEELEKRGYVIPPVPAVYIDAKNKKEAKQLLLECDSRYGKTSQEGFDAFIEDLDISAFLDQTEMSEFFGNLETVFDDINKAYQNANTEISFDDGTMYKITLKFPEERYNEVKAALEARTESPEMIFCEALGV